jgi:phosphatidylglycerophosphate synthase
MSSPPTDTTGEFEFNESQNQLIGSLARKMGLVGFVMIFFGLLQLINGVTSLLLARNPERVIAAAQKAGVSEEQLGVLKEALSGGFWSSPVTISAIAFALAGLLLFLVGLWTRQAGVGLAGIVLTKGKDISRLMEALGALHQKYGLIYSVLWAAAVVSLMSLVVTLWQTWRGA